MKSINSLNAEADMPIAISHKVPRFEIEAGTKKIK